MTTSRSKDSPAPLLYFDARGGGYWIQLPDKRFVLLDTSQAKLHLRNAGLSKEAFVGNLNELEQALLISQTERHVDYAGPLAGHKPGLLITSGGCRALVTSKPQPVEAVKGKTDAIDTFLGELLADQVPALLAWLKCGRDALLKGSFRPGTMLALAGPGGCGKSFLQQLITHWLGGRGEKCYQFLIGETGFNAQLASAEHWIIDDSAASTDIRTRRKFGAAIKEACVSTELWIHAKGRQALTLPTFRRLSLSVNDEPENITILPPLDASLIDKITLLRCSPVQCLTGDRKRDWASMAGQLPALAHALQSWRIPKSLGDARFGAKAVQNAFLVEMLNAQSPESQLLTLIETHVLKEGVDAWSGSAEELKSILLGTDSRYTVERLLYYPTACGVYLARLQARLPERVSYVNNRAGREWTLKGEK